jgi:hypothetical protein
MLDAGPSYRAGDVAAAADAGYRMAGGKQIVSAQHPVVGSWRVAVDVGHVHGPTNLAILSSDSTVLVAFPSPTPAAPGAGHQLEYWTPAVGTWQPAGDGGATMRFEALGVDEHGAPIGTHTITATVAATSGGQGWSGPFTITISGPDCAPTATVSGMVTATCISP